MYKYLLFDADNTLLDFDKAEAQALKETLALCPLGFSEEKHKRYHIINDLQWKRLERGETTRDRLRVERFELLYKEFGVDSKYAPETADIYAKRLSQQGHMIENAVDVLACLSQTYRCFIITNGITEIQNSRLSKTCIGEYIEHSFISQEMGCAKPSPVFFEKVMEYIGDSDVKRYLVIGDSLTSDIAGAVNIGMDSVWISEGESDLPTYTVDKLPKLYSILK